MPELEPLGDIAKRKAEAWTRLTRRKTTPEDWLGWRWQLRSRVENDAEAFTRLLELDDGEVKGTMAAQDAGFYYAATPYQILRVRELLEAGATDDAKAVKRTFVPDIRETFHKTGIDDGMGEEEVSDLKPEPRHYISRLYRDRMLLQVTDKCPGYCRYCFRRRKTIKRDDPRFTEKFLAHLDEIVEAIAALPQSELIHDIILSGGEPLMLADDKVEEIITRLKDRLPRLDVIRIDTKALAAMPQRITDEFVAMLRKYHPLYMTLHYIHYAEIDDEARHACAKLADAGINLGTYTPLLRGISDDAELLKKLFWELVKMRVRPYYLVQRIVSYWTRHFHVPLRESLRLLRGLHGQLSGLAVPTFKVYIPKEGKVPLLPNYLKDYADEDGNPLLETWRGHVVSYPEPHDERE